MKLNKLDHTDLARNLGSEIRGRVSAKSGYFGVLQIAEEVRRRLKPSAAGGRATDPRWPLRRLIPIRPQTLARLQDLANEVSQLVDYRVKPLQLAAVLIERDLQQPPTQHDDRETLSIATSPKFMEIIGRSRASARTDGCIPLQEIRRKYRSQARAARGRKAREHSPNAAKSLRARQTANKQG